MGLSSSKTTPTYQYKCEHCYKHFYICDRCGYSMKIENKKGHSSNASIENGLTECEINIRLKSLQRIDADRCPFCLKH